MTQDTINILNSPELIEVREYHMDRLTRLFNGEVLDEPFLLCGISSFASAEPPADPEKYVDEALTNLARNAEAAMNRRVFRPLCMEYWMYGVHFTDKVFGAKLRYEPGEGLWWTPGVENEVGELPVPDLETNETWKAAKEITLAMVEAGVKVPFYSTQVLGEPWNQTFNIYRERGLLAFYENPEGMKRDLDIVTDTLVEMHKWYRKTIPEDQFQPICTGGRCQPRGYGQMCGCSTHLISHEIYEEFIREEDEKILALYPNGGMYHLCGHHTQHCASWKEMPKVRAFQTNDLATDLFPEMYANTRDDQIFYINLTGKIDAKKALEITNGGKRCVLVAMEC